jgi:ergothioneine biosynthesis protein EgtB
MPKARTAKASLERSLAARFAAVREQTLELCAPLSPEDMQVQSMPDASPTKWHLAHSTWFFEHFVLAQFEKGYARFDESYGYLFNSYYNAVGERVARDQRGLLTRPTLEEVRGYRAAIDERMEKFLQREQPRAASNLIELGINHEQQHQELLLTDIKHALWLNPLRPSCLRARHGDRRERVGADASHPPDRPLQSSARALTWRRFDGGLTEIGHDGDGFAFDNESPRHKVFVQGFEIASRLVTNGEYLAFMEDRGYARPELWLSDGWDAVRSQGWQAPLYWEKVDGRWQHFTLAGMQPIELAAPVCHVSFYEAEAFARWAGARLPREVEWELAARDRAIAGNLLEDGRFAPIAGEGQFHGDVWEWTQSPYVGYPGYETPAGAVGEYNGKFMVNQIVLRGGSCFTPRSHIRATYRNFFGPAARWQMMGMRLAKDT